MQIALLTSNARAPSLDPRKLLYSVGKNVLGSILKTMCAVARIEYTKTNHSLIATDASDMFKAQRKWPSFSQSP